MAYGVRKMASETGSLIGLSVFAAPIVVSYALTVWTLIQYLASVAMAITGGLMALAN